MSPPTLKRNGSSNAGGIADIIQRQTVWPTPVTTANHHNDSTTHNNEGETVSIEIVLNNNNGKVFLKTPHPFSFHGPPI